MENETVCKFRSSIKIYVFWTLWEYVSRIRIKLSCWAASTQINTVIQRYLRELRNKSSVKNVQIDRNVTLNIGTLPLGLTAILSGRCYFSDLVWFNEYKPSLRFTSLHKAHAPTLLQAFAQRLYTPPSQVATDYLIATRWSVLVATPSSPFQIHQNKNTTFTVCRGWRCCRTYHTSRHLLPFPLTFLKSCLQLWVCKLKLNQVLILWISDLDSWITDEKTLYFLNSNYSTYPIFQF